MSDRRQSVATATVGGVGVGGAAALRHEALVRSHDERTDRPIPRKRLGAERRMIHKPKGRKIWLAGAGLGAVSLPAFATGVHGTLHPTGRAVTAKRDKERHSFLSEGLSGAKAAVIDRTDSVREKPPKKLVAGNYAAGVGVGSAAGGLTHLALRKAPINLHAKSAIAALTAGAAGTAALPLQSKLTNRVSHGAYKVTPTGVRRAKRAPKRASSKATVVDGRSMDPRAFRAQTVGKVYVPKKPPRGKSGMGGTRGLGAFYAPPRSAEEQERTAALIARSRAARKEAKNQRRRDLGAQPGMEDLEKMSPRTAYRTAGAHVGAHWTVQGLRAADKIDVPNRAAIPKTRRGKLVYTGRTKASALVRQAALDVGSINDKDAMARSAIHGHPLIGKRDDPGASMSRGERRARIAASGPPIPIVGDIIQARQAAKLSPEKYSRRTGAQTVGAGQAGGLAGNAAGAGIALGAARLSPGFDRRAKNANDKVDSFTNAIKDRAYSAAGKERVDKPGLTTRALQHQRTPAAARKVAARVATSPVGRAVAANPKVAAIGALVGGAVAGPAAQQAMLSHTMSRDDRYRRSLAKREATAAKPIPLSERESHTLRRRKELGAAASMLTGTTGIAALGTTLGPHALKHGRIKDAAWAKPARKKLKKATLPLVAIGGGVGGLNSFNYAHIQRSEAHQIRKALPRIPGIRRAPGMRRATLRQTRYPSGVIRTSTVRGGLA